MTHTGPNDERRHPRPSLDAEIVAILETLASPEFEGAYGTAYRHEPTYEWDVHRRAREALARLLR